MSAWTPHGRSRSTAIYYPAGARRALALASHRCRRDLALLRGRGADAEIADESCGRAYVTLGPDLTAGEGPQAIVPPHAWQAAESNGDWTLVGCTVAPGFEFAKFETGAEGLDADLVVIRSRRAEKSADRESGGFACLRITRFRSYQEERKHARHFCDIPNIQIEPAILYFGTPVVLIGSSNEDGSFNLAPMSSAWWIGWRCMLGLDPTSKTTENIIRSGECVLNLPSADLVGAVDRLARTTGTDPVPAGKIKRGYRHENDKFDLSGLTALGGDTVAAPRALECPVQLEAKLAHVHELAQDEKVWRGARAIEVRITRVHAHPAIMMEGEANRIDPDKWRPLIMSFQQFYGLTPEKLQRSELGQIPERYYKPPGWQPAA